MLHIPALWYFDTSVTYPSDLEEANLFQYHHILYNSNIGEILLYNSALCSLGSFGIQTQPRLQLSAPAHHGGLYRLLGFVHHSRSCATKGCHSRTHSQWGVGIFHEILQQWDTQFSGTLCGGCGTYLNCLWRRCSAINHQADVGSFVIEFFVLYYMIP